MLKSLTLATVALLVIAPAAQAAPLGMAQVEQTLRKAGYTQIHEIERDDGLWEADVSRADGRFSEVYVDPMTGEIFDEIHSLERDGATWSLEARNARNQKVDVRLSGYDGRILHSERDGWLD
jgi:uncharacterized membrane protein YkoI